MTARRQAQDEPDLDGGGSAADPEGRARARVVANASAAPGRVGDGVSVSR